MKDEKITVKAEKCYNFKFIAILFLIVSILVMIPSIIFIILNKKLNIINEINATMFLNLFNTKIDKKYPIFLIVAIVQTILFLLMCKFRKYIFKDFNSLLKFIVIIGIIYAVMLPTSSTDIFTYIASGRMQTKYKENPYYTSPLDIIKKNPKDSIMQNVGKNWQDEKATYGPYWELIEKIYSFFSINNIYAYIYVYKIMALILLVISALIIKKITNNDLYVMLFAVNPYVLYQFVANAHNDLYVIFFCILAIYLFKVKNNKKMSIASLAIATSIKYYPILFAPFFIFYFSKDNKNVKDKIKIILLYSAEYIAITMLPYLLYAKNIKIIFNPLIQQEKFNYSLQGTIYLLSNKNNKLIDIISKIIMYLFVGYYIYLLTKDFILKKNVTFKEILEDLAKITIFFILAVITCYNSWYIGWIIPLMLYNTNEKNRYFTYWELSSFLFDHEIYNRNLSIAKDSQFIIVILYLVFLIFIVLDSVYYYFKKYKTKKKYA